METKTIKYAALCAVLLGGGLFGWHLVADLSKADASQDGRQDVPVVAAQTQCGDLATTVVLTAGFRSHQQIDIHAKVAGFVRSIRWASATT